MCVFHYILSRLAGVHVYFWAKIKKRKSRPNILRSNFPCLDSELSNVYCLYKLLVYYELMYNAVFAVRYFEYELDFSCYVFWCTNY